MDLAVRVIQIALEGFQIVRLRAVLVQALHQIIHDVGRVDAPIRMRFSGLFAVYAHQRCHHAGHIRAFRLDRHRIGRKRVLLHVVDIGLNAVGEGQDQRNSDDADGAREGGQDRAGLLCHQVIEAQTQRRKKRHGRAPLTGFRLHRRLRRVFIRRAVRQNASVEQPHRPRGVARGKLRIVRDHNNEFLVRNLL